MKIVIYNPKSEFSPTQQRALSQLGEVIYTNKRQPLPTKKLLNMAKGADIIAADPDAFGGFEQAQPILTQVMNSLPNLKGDLFIYHLLWLD